MLRALRRRAGHQVHNLWNIVAFVATFTETAVKKTKIIRFVLLEVKETAEKGPGASAKLKPLYLEHSCA